MLSAGSWNQYPSTKPDPGKSEPEPRLRLSRKQYNDEEKMCRAGIINHKTALNYYDAHYIGGPAENICCSASNPTDHDLYGI